MNWFVVFLILILALAGMGTIWYLGTQASCKLPPKNTCTGTSTTGSGRLQVPYCADQTSRPECEDPETLCGTIPADCNAPNCDYTSKKWKCSTGKQMWSCVNNTCTVDPNGTFSSQSDCSKTCHSPGQSCALVSGNLPYPVTDGSTVYTDFTKVPDQYGTYTYKMIGTVPACQISCNSTKSKMVTDKSGIWCDPIDDGTSCSSTQLKDLKPFPNDPYKGVYADANAQYVLAYMNYNNKNQYCKFDKCISGYKGNPCISASCPKDPLVTQWDDNCKVVTCINGYSPNADKSSCVKNPCTSTDPHYKSLDPTTCNITECNNGSDGITIYTPDASGSKCVASSCNTDTVFTYAVDIPSNSCIKSGCVANSDPRKNYLGLPDCNADCTGDSCKAFIGVDANAGYPFSCDNAGRSCTVHSDGTGWGGCGSTQFPQYGPNGTGGCALSVFEQRARFNDGTDTTSPMGCITCLGGAAGTNCSPWETDPTQCSFAEGCTYGQAKHLGTPTDAINECINENQNKYIGYVFNNITTLPSGEQASLYTNDGSINGNLNGGYYNWKGMSPGSFSFNKNSGTIIAGNDYQWCDSQPLSLSGVFNSMTNPPRNSGSLNVSASGDCVKIAGEYQGQIVIQANY